MEKAFFFENEGLRLFAYVHTPGDKIMGNGVRASCGMVLCPPFGEEHRETYRIIRDFAVKLCKKGIPVLRFDYRGCGDSEGEFEEVTPDTQISDIREAIEVLKDVTGVKAVGLLGLRLGGVLALLTAQLEPTSQFVAIWAPILSPKMYFQGIVRQQTFSVLINREKRKTTKDLIAELNQGGKVDIGGYYLSGKAYNAFCGIDFIKSLQQTGPPVYIALLDQDDTNLDKSVIEQLRNMTKSNVKVVTVHEEPFWKSGTDRFIPAPTRLIQETIGWLSDMKFSQSIFKESNQVAESRNV